MNLPAILTITSLVLCGLNILAEPLIGKDYSIALESDGKTIANVNLEIAEDKATATSDDNVEHFDLKKQRWQHDKLKVWVSLAQCKTWAEKSKAKSNESLEKAPDEIRRFLEWSMNPQFKVEMKGGKLLMTSGQVDYEITARKTDEDTTAYFRYARLNAYKKAMIQRKVPPFAELKVLDELQRRKLMPTVIDVAIPGIPRAPSLKMLITEKAGKSTKP